MIFVCISDGGLVDTVREQRGEGEKPVEPPYAVLDLSGEGDECPVCWNSTWRYVGGTPVINAISGKPACVVAGGHMECSSCGTTEEDTWDKMIETWFRVKDEFGLA